MQSSCAQERLSDSSQSCSTGIGRPAAYRCTTAMKTIIVAAAIREAISHSSRRSRNLSMRSSWTVSLRMFPMQRRHCGLASASGVLRVSLLGLESGVLVNGLDDVLADPAFLLFVHCEQRFFPRGLFLRRKGDDLRLAGLLYTLECVLVLFFGDIVGVLGGVLHCAFKRAANVRRQAVPELLVDDHGILDHAMVGHGEILLHLVHLLRVEIRRRVLGAVDDAGLESLVDLRERHLLRYSAERANLRFENVRRLDAQLEPFDVSGNLERLVRAEILETVVPIRQSGDALAFELRE